MVLVCAGCGREDPEGVWVLQRLRFGLGGPGDRSRDPQDTDGAVRCVTGGRSRYDQNSSAAY
jgi:hypothetical protein